jgi:hypothetical protein
MIKFLKKINFIALIMLMSSLGVGAQTVGPAFSGNYTLDPLNNVTGLPGNAGGLAFKNGDTSKLIIGGNANRPSGAVYEISVQRNSSGNITGWVGSATQISTAPNIDGGLSYGPILNNGVSPNGSVLFFTTYSDNKLGQIKSGSSTHDRLIDLTSLGVSSSTGAVGFVPTGFAGAGRIKIVSYTSGEWYDGVVTAATGANSGTYDVSALTLKASLPRGGPEGFVFVKAGSPNFSNDSIVIADYSNYEFHAYEIDSNGDPIVSTKRVLVTGLSGAIGASIDPLTGDFIFGTFGSPGPVFALRGFLPPSAPTTYTIGGAVTGLASGQSVVLLNNGGNSTTVNSNTNFSFSTSSNSGDTYAVTVGTQPTGQTCTVTNGSGTATANVTTVSVTCVADTYTIGGAVTGLAAGQSVVLLNNAGNSTTVNSNTSFTFSTAINSGGAYAVTVGTQPTGQTCTVTNGSGTASANVTNVSVTCVTNTYTVGGSVTGLAAGQSVVLLNNAGNSTTVNSNTSFTFSTAINSGGTYSVTVATQPTGQTCTVTNGSGTATANVTGVSVSCVVSTVNGSCGTAANTAASILPSNNLCTAGTAGSVSSSQGQYSWTCSGIGGGTNASCTAPWAPNAGTGSGSVTASGNGWIVSSASFTVTPPVALPRGVALTNGLLDLTLTTGTSGSDATVVVQYTTAVPAGAVYMKYGKTAARPTDHWYQLDASRAVFAADRMSVTLTLTDGGAGDNDLAANNTIVDPGGPAVVTPDPIPTLSEWAMILLASLMGMFAYTRMRRQK